MGSGGGAISRVRAASDAAGELVVTWRGSKPDPLDYEFIWTRNDQSFSADRRLYPSTERAHLTGLNEGRVYKFSLRSRYSGPQGPYSFIFAKPVSTAADLLLPPEPESTLEPEPEPYNGGAVLGTMTVGTATYETADFEGDAVSGYATRGGGMGSFDVAAWADSADIGSNGDMRSLIRTPGEFILQLVGEVTDSLFFAYASELDTPFTQQLGDVRLSSNDAVNPGGYTANVSNYWVWEDITPGWETGDEVTVRVAEGDTAPPTPLTAEFVGADALSHRGGGSQFQFKLRFGGEFDLSYVTLRDHAFTVAGGEVVNARRLHPPSNVLWEITVQASGGAAVTIELPATTDCDDTGAICTADGTMLSTPPMARCSPHRSRSPPQARPRPNRPLPACDRRRSDLHRRWRDALQPQHRRVPPLRRTKLTIGQCDQLERARR